MANHWWARLALGRTTVADPLLDLDQPDGRPDTEWRPGVKTRLIVMLGILAVWAVVIEAQLVRLQVVGHTTYTEKAAGQQQHIIHPEAPRGDILDRTGQLLAYSVESYDVHADPLQVKDAAAEAQDICEAFADCTPDDLATLTTKLRPRVSKGKTQDVIIRTARMLAPDAAERLQALLARRKKEKQKPVLSLEPRIWRYYPKLELASHVVGYLNGEGKAAGGVESRFDGTIRGREGEVIAYQDAFFRELSTLVQRAPTPGTSIELTIDQTIQYIAERELRAAIAATHAASGTVVVMDPRTGEILALASWPYFNPNDPGASSDAIRRNRAVQEVYEPGSTFKIVTVSAAINDGFMQPSDLIDTAPGHFTPEGRSKPIDEAKGHNYGVLSLEDVIVRSSNVGAAKIGIRVGADRMAQTAQRFGFGQKIAPDFAGESRGVVNPADKLTESALASMSMGYEVSVTPIQMAAAASVVANGGELIEPHLVRALVKDGQRAEFAPKTVRRVITPQTAAAITTMMEGVVALKEGTGDLAALDRYRVAGKTGTAAKAIKGGYSTTDYNVSFVGFVPSRDPAFTILVVIDSPQVGPKYGGTVAAPVFKRIAEAALQYVGVKPSINALPPVIIATDRSLLPTQPARAAAVLPAPTRVGGRPVMPDLRGLTMRDAMRVAGQFDLTFTSTQGDGVVVAQSPAPGVVMGPSDRVTLELRRLPAGPGGSHR